jgi:hypothetical protein
MIGDPLSLDVQSDNHRHDSRYPLLGDLSEELGQYASRAHAELDRSP